MLLNGAVLVGVFFIAVLVVGDHSLQRFIYAGREELVRLMQLHFSRLVHLLSLVARARLARLRHLSLSNSRIICRKVLARHSVVPRLIHRRLLRISK